MICISNDIDLSPYILVLCKDITIKKLGARRKRSPYEEESNQFPSLYDDDSRSKRQVDESEEEILQRSYGSNLGYECGLARRFEDPETSELYSERWMTCNWNKTWTPVDSLDECTWIQCINPPQVHT